MTSPWYTINSTPELRLEFDVPDHLLDVTELEAHLPDTLMDITIATRNFWESEAGRRLRASRQRYVDSLEIQQSDDKPSVVLKGAFANMVENGNESWDMKPGFNNSSKLKSGRIKIPRDKALELKAKPKKPYNPSRRWMIIPLDINHTGTPTVFRTYTTDAPADKWIYPEREGVKIQDQVVEELENNIIPEYVNKLIDKAFGQ